MSNSIFGNLSNCDEELKEIIELYESLPFSDSYKHELYQNIFNIIEYEKEWYSPMFRIINDYEPGSSLLSEIGNSAIKIQEMFTYAYKRIANFSETLHNQTALEKTAIQANIKHGSIIFEFEKIGKENPGQEDLIDLNTDKVKLLNELINDAYAMDNDIVNIQKYIGKYGMKSLKSFKDFINELENNDSYFEYSNLVNDIKLQYSKTKIENILSSISNVQTVETVSDFEIRGYLVGINTESGKLIFRNYDDKKITVNILDNSLQTNKISVNKHYKLLVRKNVQETLESVKEFYECPSINGTTLVE